MISWNGDYRDWISAPGGRLAACRLTPMELGVVIDWSAARMVPPVADPK
jgi:hypothetical protein